MNLEKQYRILIISWFALGIPLTIAAAEIKQTIFNCITYFTCGGWVSYNFAEIFKRWRTCA